DVMDGHFVPNITFGPPTVRSIRAVSPRLFLDAHLMIAEPMKYIDAFIEAGVENLTLHVEVLDNPGRAMELLRKKGIRASIVVKPKTPIRDIESVLDRVDMVLVMTVEPGFGGQGLMPTMLNKVRELARMRDEQNLKFLIQVDGGINPKTAGLAVAAGANVLVAGSAIFGGRNIAQCIQELTNAGLQMGAK
ncbi:ribulose-phosphate 3-epimerase, partial [bacterium]|nr:ribulose-phosphate 3-epimerase [bacterium]